jgi:hypothetical protein
MVAEKVTTPHLLRCLNLLIVPQKNRSTHQIKESDTNVRTTGSLGVDRRVFLSNRYVKHGGLRLIESSQHRNREGEGVEILTMGLGK